ncbi:hypothetical protein HPB47_008910, partial [Ixodes persulcatus]
MLQLFTLAYITLLASLVLGSMLMVASLFEIGVTQSEHNRTFFDYMFEVSEFIFNVSKSLNGFQEIQQGIQDADHFGFFEGLKAQNTLYIILVLVAFTTLFFLYAGSFIMGMFHYNELIQPTKRSNASNYCGLAML